MLKLSNERVVLIPTYKSSADPFILYFIQYMYDLQLGFTFGNDNDTPKAIEGVLKRMGHLLINRDYTKNPIL